MGKAWAPAYANLFMASWEQKLYTSLPLHLHPALWKRFIDDIFGIFRGSTSEWDEFLQAANQVDPHIRLTAHTDPAEVPFLDLVVFRDGDSLGTRLHRKPTDTLQYVRASSMHPTHTHTAIATSQFLRALRNCSLPGDQDHFCRETAATLRSRGYNPRLLRKTYRRAKLRHAANTTIPKKPRDILVLTYFHNHAHLPGLLRQHHQTFQTTPLGRDLHRKFPEPPMVAWRRSRNLRDHLIRAQT